MPHLYPRNISEYILLKLHQAFYPASNFKWDGVIGEKVLVGGSCVDRKTPLQITLKEITDHFINRILAVQEALKKIDDPKQRRVITEMMEELYGAHAADGTQIDRWAIEMMANECLACWASRDLVKKGERGWFLTENGRKLRINEMIIEYIDL